MKISERDFWTDNGAIIEITSGIPPNNSTIGWFTKYFVMHEFAC